MGAPTPQAPGGWYPKQYLASNTPHEFAASLHSPR